MSDLHKHSLNEEIPLEASQALQVLFDPSLTGQLPRRDKGLYRAIYGISKSIDFEIKMPDELEGSLEHILQTISILSGFRFQKILLHEPGWWNKDNGPLLAIKKDTGEYVCLVPMAGGGYKNEVEPSVMINEKAAALYEPFAYTFFLPLPDREVHIFDILKLSLNPSRRELASIVVTQVTLGLIGILTPIFFGLIVDYAIPLSDRSMLFQIVYGLLGAAICGLILTVLQTIAHLRVNLKSTSFVQSALWERLVRLPLSFYRKFGVGELIDRINGLDRVYQEINVNLLKSCLTCLWAIITLLILFYYASAVAWIALGLTFFLSLLVVTISLIQLRYLRKMYFIEGRSSNLLLQILSGIKKIRTTHLEKPFFINWINLLTQRLHYFMKARWLSIQFGCIQSFLMIIATVLVYGYFAEQGSPSLGSFITVNALLGNFIASFMAFTSSLMNYLFIVPLYNRIKPVLACIPEGRQNQKINPSILKDIEFRNLTFYYEESNVKVVDNVSLSIHEGQFVAVVGSSGSGKSTLLRLLLGLELPQEGKIFVNGVDLNHISLTALRMQCGVVLQTTNLMAGTLLDNFTGIDQSVSEETVMSAIKLANLEAEVKALPMGLQTLVMDHGSSFSLGQRQRFLIARALCHHPKILILDEATSALDNVNQHIIHENLSRLGVTRLVVAHRLSTIEKADYIYVMEKGRIVEQGTFKTLLKQKGYFFKMATQDRK